MISWGLFYIGGKGRVVFLIPYKNDHSKLRWMPPTPFLETKSISTRSEKATASSLCVGPSPSQDLNSSSVWKKRQDCSFASCRCELEEEHNHKKLLEAVQGHAAPHAPDGFFRNGGHPQNCNLIRTGKITINHRIFGYPVCLTDKHNVSSQDVSGSSFG